MERLPGGGREPGELLRRLRPALERGRRDVPEGGLAAEGGVVAPVHGLQPDQGGHLPGPVADQVRGQRGGRLRDERRRRLLEGADIGGAGPAAATLTIVSPSMRTSWPEIGRAHV